MQMSPWVIDINVYLSLGQVLNPVLARFFLAVLKLLKLGKV